MTLKTVSTPEGYDLTILNEPTCQARRYFEALDGELKMRTIDLRPEGQYVNVFQIKSEVKRDQNSLVYIFIQELFVNENTFHSLKTFLRKSVVDVPAEKDERPPVEFTYYYKTSFTKVPVTFDLARDKVNKVRESIASSTPHFETPEKQEKKDSALSASLCATLDSTHFLLHMIQPELMEQKLQELEMSVRYAADINVKTPKMKEGNMESLLHEYKRECGHLIFERRKV